MAGPNFWSSIGSSSTNLGNGMADRLMQIDEIGRAADYRRQIMERQQEQDKQQRNMLGITDGEPGGYIALDRRRADQERADAKTEAEAADANWNKVLDDPSLNDEMSAYDFYNLATRYNAQLHPKAIQNYSVRNAREKAKAEAEKATAKAAAEKQKQDDLRKYQQGQLGLGYANLAEKNRHNIQMEGKEWSRINYLNGNSKNGISLQSQEDLQYAKDIVSALDKAIAEGGNKIKFINDQGTAITIKANNTERQKWQGAINTYGMPSNTKPLQPTQPASPPASQSNPLGITRK